MSSDPNATWLPTGALLEERWQIHGKLGRGGFATVYYGEHIKLERKAAIKVLDIQSTPEEMLVFEERFLREAKLAAKLDHPHIVQILDYGMTRRDGVTKPFLVMEQLTGHDLEYELITYGPLSRERAKSLFLPALDALALCHSQGVVHRDLKPSNLFIAHPRTSRERLVILDFGIARAFDDPNSKLTATSHFTGTPAYLAPEYISEQKVSPALDVYQMGLILSESLTGTPVVQASAPLGYLMAHCSGKQHIPEPLASTIIGSVLGCAVRVEPEERFVDAGALKNALEQAPWEELPEQWHTAQKSSLVGTFPDAPVITQEGVNPWGETMAPTDSQQLSQERPAPHEIPTDPVTFDGSATHPDMMGQQLTPHSNLKLLFAGIFAVGVLLAGGAAMVIALRTPPPAAQSHEEDQSTTQITETHQPVVDMAPPIDASPMVVEVSQTQDMTDAVAIPAKPKPVASKVVTPTLPKKEPATIESTTKEAVEEAFDLLAPTQVDNKLANGHRAIVLMTLDIERSHINLKKRIKELEPEDRVHEAISYFSEVHDDYELAATYLERLAKHDPAHSKLDASARDLAKIVRKIAAVHEKAYAFRQDKYALHTRETVLEYVTALAPLIEQYKPAHEKFLLAFFEEERVMLEERFQKTRAATSPLIHHHHGLLLSLARAMESTERYNHTNKTKPYLRQLRAHMKALEEFNIHDYKSELSSQVRNNAHTTQQAVLRTSIEFANYQKALGKYGKASRHDLDAHSKLISAYIDLYRMYNFAMKKYTTRPKL